jgi:hypothetical protein
MVIKIYRTLLKILFGLLVCCSCASPIALHQSFTKHRSSLRYIHDSDHQQDSTASVVTIGKPAMTFSQMNGPGVVRQTKSSAIPLIIFNSWSSEYQYLLGRTGIKENIASFVQESIMEEARRSATFQPTLELDNANLLLEIEIDSIGASGVYKIDGYFFFVLMAYGYGQNEHADPGTAFSRFRYRLSKGDEILLEDVTSVKQVSKPLLVRHDSKNDLRRFFNANLVEALSFTLKTNIEIIIEDINLYLFQQNSSLRMEESKIGTVTIED